MSYHKNIYWSVSLSQQKSILLIYREYLLKICLFSFTLLERPEKFIVEAEPFGCSIKLSWKPPPSRGCPITRYSVHYKEAVVSADAMLSTWQRKYLNITDRDHLRLDCDKRYNIIVLAWNERGHSVFDTDSVVSVWTEMGMKLYKNQSHVVERWIIMQLL